MFEMLPTVVARSVRAPDVQEWFCSFSLLSSLFVFSEACLELGKM
jgi:hypothetical protein